MKDRMKRDWGQGRLDLPCYIFDKNLEEVQTFLERVNTLSNPDTDKLLPKFNVAEYSKFKIDLKRMEMLNIEVIYENKFYAMCMTELQYKHKAHQTLQTTMFETRVEETYLVSKI